MLWQLKRVHKRATAVVGQFRGVGFEKEFGEIMIDDTKIKIIPVIVQGNSDQSDYGDTFVEYDNERCPYVEVSGGLAKRWIGLETIKKDLEICKELLSDLANEKYIDPLIRNAIFESIITKYGRCFVSAKDGRGIKLDAEKTFVGTRLDLFDIHKSIMHERNNFTAHAGDSNSDIVCGRLSLLPLSKGKGIINFYLTRDTVIRSNQTKTASYLVLFLDLIDYVDDLLNPIYKKLGEDYFSRDIDELYKQSIYWEFEKNQ